MTNVVEGIEIGEKDDFLEEKKKLENRKKMLTFLNTKGWLRKKRNGKYFFNQRNISENYSFCNEIYLGSLAGCCCFIFAIPLVLLWIIVPIFGVIFLIIAFICVIIDLFKTHRELTFLDDEKTVELCDKMYNLQLCCAGDSIKKNIVKIQYKDIKTIRGLKGYIHYDVVLESISGESHFIFSPTNDVQEGQDDTRIKNMVISLCKILINYLESQNVKIPLPSECKKSVCKPNVPELSEDDKTKLQEQEMNTELKNSNKLEEQTFEKSVY